VNSRYTYKMQYLSVKALALLIVAVVALPATNAAVERRIESKFIMLSFNVS
jgi:hypothetical protein